MVEGSFIGTLAASLLASAITALGIVVISRFEAWGRRQIVYFMSFAAGILITVSFLHLIPESFAMTLRAPTMMLVGFMILYLSNRFLRLHLGEAGRQASLGLIPMVGIGFHSLVDGVIYAVTFNVSVFTGWLAAAGMILHEFPEGIITFLLLKHGGLTGRRAMVWAFLAAGATTPLGALLSYPFVRTITRPLLGGLLALAAGALIYVGATHLLPAVEREDRRYAVLALASGMVVAILILLTGHGER